MKLSDLDGMVVLDAKGAKLGRIYEVHAVDGRVAEVVYGRRGLIERLTGKAQLATIAWSHVAGVSGRGVVLNGAGSRRGE